MTYDWTNDPRMKNMDPRKIMILTDLAKEAEGVSMEKSLPLLLKANAQLKALGLTFTKEESDLMLQILTQNLTPADRVKIDAIMKMMR